VIGGANVVIGGANVVIGDANVVIGAVILRSAMGSLSSNEAYATGLADVSDGALLKRFSRAEPWLGATNTPSRVRARARFRAPMALT
jgi:hypothetical protein